MLVTEITEVSGSRIKIRIDDKSDVVLYKGEARSLGISKDQEFGDEVYRKIMDEILPVRAKKRVLNLLRSRDYTSAQLMDKLKTGGYPAPIAKEAVEYAASFGYVDDDRYAFHFIECKKGSRSRKRIFTDLSRKGISEAVIEKAWEEAAGDQDSELEREQILRWIRKKNFSFQTASVQEKQKMMGFLYRKGFSVENIRSVLSLDITAI